MADLLLQFEGPFTFTDGDHCVFHPQLTNSPGIYLWTIKQKKDNTHLIHYVGETTQLGIRHHYHLIQILGLNYGIFHPERAEEGVSELLWKGLWRDHTETALARTTAAYHDLHEHIFRYVNAINIFFAELRIDRKFSRHIEGCIGLNLRKNHPQCKQLYPDDNHVGAMKEKTNGVLHITAAEVIQGLDEYIPY